MIDTKKEQEREELHRAIWAMRGEIEAGNMGFDYAAMSDEEAEVACEDTLTAPQHWDDESFELIVSNPPYSIKWAGNDGGGGGYQREDRYCEVKCRNRGGLIWKRI